jgi:hypothetical protein
MFARWLKSLWDALRRRSASIYTPLPPGAGATFTPALTVPLVKPARIEVHVCDWSLLRQSRAVAYLSRSGRMQARN